MMQAPTWFLDYKKCTPAELRRFITDRAGNMLDQRGLRKLQFCNRVKLTYRLRKMDQDGKFPRFMELPPELRLGVYQSLLVDERVWSDGKSDWQAGYDDYRIHPAVLRTSKQIYSEAMPILYDQNKSHATIEHVRGGSRGRWSSAWTLDIVHPGRRFPFHQKMPDPHYTPVMGRLFESSTMDMMRVLKHLTVNLNLVKPEGLSLVRWSGGRDAVAILCLSLTGASKMTELTLKINSQDSQISDSDLVDILWPLLFLQTDIVVKFEGLSALPLGETSANSDSWGGPTAPPSPLALQDFCERVARTRIGCKDAREQRSLDFNRLDDIDEVLDRMNFSGAWVDIADIVSLSAKWRSMKGYADYLEATW